MLADRRCLAAGDAAVPGRRGETTTSTCGREDRPVQSLQVRLSSRLPDPGTASLAGEHGAQTASRHLRHRCGRRRRVNSASQTPHHRSDSDPREEEDTVVDSDDDDELREREPPPPPPLGCPACADESTDGDNPRLLEIPWEERRLRSARGPADADPVRSDDTYLRCDWCRSSCRCLPEASGVDEIDRLEPAEEASDSPPPREESREEERFSEAERDEERLPRPSEGDPAGLFELRLLRLLELDCCFSQWLRSDADSGMLTRAWVGSSMRGTERAGERTTRSAEHRYIYQVLPLRPFSVRGGPR